jgi:hypothetical protein
MEKRNDFKQFGEKTNHRLLVVLTKSQKDRIRMLAEASGYKTISNFVRVMLLNPSFHEKFNFIIEQNAKANEALIKIMEELQNGSKH